jgi:aspartate racemase
MAQAVQGLLDHGADLVVLACTEAPIALAAAPADLQARCVDSTQALAEATVMLWQQPAADSGLRSA